MLDESSPKKNIHHPKNSNITTNQLHININKPNQPPLKTRSPTKNPTYCDNLPKLKLH